MTVFKTLEHLLTSGQEENKSSETRHCQKFHFYSSYNLKTVLAPSHAKLAAK